MILSFKIEEAQNGFLVYVEKSGSSMGIPGFPATRPHVFLSEEEAEAFICTEASSFRIKDYKQSFHAFGTHGIMGAIGHITTGQPAQGWGNVPQGDGGAVVNPTATLNPAWVNLQDDADAVPQAATNEFGQ